MENIIQILTKLGISPDALTPEKYEEMLKIGDEIKNDSNISLETTRKMRNILGIINNRNTTNSIKKNRICKRNEPCPCLSGKKFKKCCGIIKN